MLKTSVLQVFREPALPGKDILVYIAIGLAVLLFRPSGILGRRARRDMTLTAPVDLGPVRAPAPPAPRRRGPGGGYR